MREEVGIALEDQGAGPVGQEGGSPVDQVGGHVGGHESGSVCGGVEVIEASFDVQVKDQDLQSTS